MFHEEKDLNDENDGYEDISHWGIDNTDEFEGMAVSDRNRFSLEISCAVNVTRSLPFKRML